MRQALYRTYRPVRFEDVVGQSHVRTILRNQIAAGELGHAYLFTGPKGTGKTSIARIVARAANCLDQKEGEPCGVCAMCKAFDNNQMLDLIEIDAASNRGIDNVRDLISKVPLSPSMGKYKVYVVDEAHQLTKEAANALLKTLEEPPAHAIFILATTEADKLLPTIVSRCQRFDFRYLKTAEIADWLTKVAEEEKIEIEKEAIEFIAGQAVGGMRDALSWLDQARMLGGKITKGQIIEGFGFVDSEEVLGLTRLVVAGNAAGGIAKLAGLVEAGFDMGRVASAWSQLGRELLTIRLGNNDLLDGGQDHIQAVSELAGRFSVDQLIELSEMLLTASREVKTAVIPQMPLEILVVKVAAWFTDDQGSGSGKQGGDAPRVAVVQTVAKVVTEKPAIEPTVVSSPVTQVTDTPTSMVGQSGVVWPENTTTLWQQIVTSVRANSPTLAATLASAEPEFASDGLRLKFAKAFHKQKMEETKSQALIRAALASQEMAAPVICVVDEDRLKEVAPVDLAKISEVFEM